MYREIKGVPRYRGVRPLGSLLPRVVEGCIGKRNTLTARLMAHWVEIMGEDIGRHSTPLALQVREGKALLRLEADPGYATMIQHMTLQIQERIGLFLGGVPVVSVKVSQSANWKARWQQPSVQNVRKNNRKENAGKAVVSAESIADEPLRQVLEEYGNRLLSHGVFNK